MGSTSKGNSFYNESICNSKLYFARNPPQILFNLLSKIK